MATSQKKKTTKPKTNSSNRKTTGNGNRTNRKKKNASSRSSSNRKIQQETYADLRMLLCVGGLMVLFVCANLGYLGSAGKYVAGVFFGLFGIVQYVLPFAVFLAAVFLVRYNYSAYIIRKITLSGVFAVLLCAFCHALVHIDWGIGQLGDSFQYSSVHKTAGGVLGALITGIFYPYLGESGTKIFLFLSMLILFLFVAGRTMIQLIQYIQAWYVEDEEELQAREELQAKRQERIFQKQKFRKDKRKNRYEQAIQKEDALAQLEAKRLARKQQLENSTASKQDLYHTLKVVSGEEGLKEKSKETGKELLLDQGFEKSKRTSDFSENAILQAEKKEQKPKNQKHNKQDLKKEEQTVSDKKHVTVSQNGELQITGLFEDGDEDNFTSEILEEKNKKLVLQPESFQYDATTVVDTKETRAEFIDEMDLEEKQDMVLSSGIGTASAAKADDVTAKTASHRRTQATAKEAAEETAKTAAEIAASEVQADNSHYEFPLLELLSPGLKAKGNKKGELQATAKKLEDTLASFGVHVTVTNVSCGPAVTRYEMLPEQGTRVNRITNLADDIKLNLAVADIRIEAPIPGKAAIGIEVPNKEASAVAFRDLLEQSDFMSKTSDLSFAVGKDIGGNVVISDIGKMPHVLIAGATGSGKSVCINTLIMSLLYKAHPDDVKLIMIDPKVVELSVYNGIPHLLIPVVTDPKKASGALNWAVAEMESRYKKFAQYNVRNLEGYNKKVETLNKNGDNPDGEIKKMPKIVIIVDELADLMMVAHGEVEDAIVRLSQLARAAGIHLVIATQRPSVDVITGLIKANVPSRIAFAVSSGVDSRTILDMNGAEKLLGKGDMLFAPSGYPKPVRVQGAFVSDKEVSRVVEFLKAQNLKMEYDDNITKEINCGPQSVRDANRSQDRDEYFIDAGRFIIEKDKASIGMLQRMYKIGFNRAARIMDQLSEAGVVGPEEGTKPRQILMTMEEFENALEQGL